MMIMTISQLVCIASLVVVTSCTTSSRLESGSRVFTNGGKLSCAAPAGLLGPKLQKHATHQAAAIIITDDFGRLYRVEAAFDARFSALQAKPRQPILSRFVDEVVVPTIRRVSSDCHVRKRQFVRGLHGGAYHVEVAVPGGSVLADAQTGERGASLRQVIVFLTSDAIVTVMHSGPHLPRTTGNPDLSSLDKRESLRFAETVGVNSGQ
jgi:hypothetical protein